MALTKLLQKIEWKTRKWHLEFNLLNISFPNDYRLWGFDLIQLKYLNKNYSFLSIHFYLPNVSGRNKIQLHQFDFLFLRNSLGNIYDDLMDDKFWAGSKGLKGIHKFKYKVLHFLFK
jgi:hypothetical protein